MIDDENFRKKFNEVFGKEIKTLIHEEGEQSPLELYTHYRKMTNKERWGLWKRIAAQMNATNKNIQNYFHNTWQKQFYMNTYVFKDEIIQLIHKNLQKYPSDQVNKVVVTQFMKIHDDIHLLFNVHQLQQTVGLLKFRMQNKHVQSKKISQKIQSDINLSSLNTNQLTQLVNNIIKKNNKQE